MLLVPETGREPVPTHLATTQRDPTSTPRVVHQPQTNWPPALPADVSSIDAILGSVFASTSGPAGNDTDVRRFQSLFKPDARLISSRSNPDGSFGYEVRDPASFSVAQADWVRNNGNFETIRHAITERYANLAHVFVTYEWRQRSDTADPDGVGLSSFQLMHDGRRWWIVSWFWRGELEGHPISIRYGSPGDHL